MEALKQTVDDLQPIDQVPPPQKGVAFRVLGVLITLPLTWFLLSFVDTALAVIIGASVVAAVAVTVAVLLGSQQGPTR
jgi:hypothetical protein